MRISILEIEPAEIYSEIDDSASLKIAGGAGSQFADISLSGFTSNGYASVNLQSKSFGGDPFLQFRTGLDVVETDEGVSSISSVYIRSGSGRS